MVPQVGTAPSVAHVPPGKLAAQERVAFSVPETATTDSADSIHALAAGRSVLVKKVWSGDDRADMETMLIWMRRKAG